MEKNKLHKYKDGHYLIIGATRTKNSQTRKWEDHTLYIPFGGGPLCTREKTEFESRFKIDDSDFKFEHYPAMKTSRVDVLKQLHQMWDQGKGLENVADYITELVRMEVEIAVRNVLLLDSVPIENRLARYVNPLAEKFWLETNNYIDDTPYQPGDPQSRTLHAVHMGATFERTYKELTEKFGTDGFNISAFEQVYEEEYEAFAKLINKAAIKGWIERGCVLKPIQIPLAVVSPSRRTAIVYAPMSAVPLRELREISNMFIAEGELPPLLNNIYFKD